RPGHRERGAHLARCEHRQPALTLLAGAVVAEQVARDERPVDDPRQGRPAARELDHDSRVDVEAEPEAAVLLRNRDAEQAERAHLRDQLRRELVGVLELRRDRDDLAVDPVANRRDDLRLLDRRRQTATFAPRTPYTSGAW